MTTKEVAGRLRLQLIVTFGLTAPAT